MRRSVDVERIIRVAHDVVEQVVPHELPYFSALSALYRMKPGSVLKQQAMKDEELGFGVEGMVQALTPLILLIVEQVIAQTSSDLVSKNSSILARSLWKKLFKRSSPHTQQQAAPVYTFAEIRKCAYETACEFEITEAKANQIADALAGKLVLQQEEKEKI